MWPPEYVSLLAKPPIELRICAVRKNAGLYASVSIVRSLAEKAEHICLRRSPLLLLSTPIVIEAASLSFTYLGKLD